MAFSGEGSIEEMLRQAANEVIHANVPEGFEWIEEYQQYYSRDSGYYYDPNTMLFYSGDTLTYYRYNEETYTYDVVECCQPTKWSSSGYRKRAIQAVGEAEFKRFTQENVDVCETLFNVIGKLLKTEHLENPKTVKVSIPTAEEIRKILQRKRKFKTEKEFFDEVSGQFHQDQLASTSENNAHSSDEEEDDKPEKFNNDERADMMKEEGFDEAPCLRIIDKNGKLFIITISGGYIGSDPDSEVLLTNKLLPERCAEINYSEEIGCYSIVKLEKSSVVTCNGNSVKVDSPVDICHSDVILISGERFDIHVHFGSNTCPSCEPGLYQNAETEESEGSGQAKYISGELARRKTLKKLMNSYGIAPDQSLNGPIRKKPAGPSLMNIERTDVQRNSQDPYGNCAAKPVPENQRKYDLPQSNAKSTEPEAPKPITSENVGFKLLKSMGWKEGKGLGKDKQGTVEPISTEVKKNRQGLGSSIKTKEKPKTHKEVMLEKMKERFNERR